MIQARAIEDLDCDAMDSKGRQIRLHPPPDSFPKAADRFDRRHGGEGATEARADLAEALRRVASGDRPAFRTVFERTSGFVFALLLRMLGEQAVAHDALQEVYMRVWSEASSFDAARASPITWIGAIARHRAIDVLRSRRPAVPIDDRYDLTDAAASALDVMLDREEASRLESCLRALPAENREALMGAFFGGMTHEEIAQSSHLPLGTVKSRIRRALIRLRACMERKE